MIRRSLWATGAAVLFAVAAGGAAAADADKLQAMENAKTSLTQAIEKAETEGQGKAIDVEFEATKQGGQYEVKVLSQDKLMNYKIDGASGTVVGSDNEPIEKFFTRLKPEEVQATQTTLVQAVGIAEKSAGGRATAAEVEREAELVQYDVEIIKADGSKQRVRVDGSSGQIAESK